MSNRKKKRTNRRQIAFILLSLVLLAFGLRYYYLQKEVGVYQRGHFVNPDSSKSVNYKLEIADSDSERQRGLMYRKELPEREGMIFIFPDTKSHAFWMKETYVSLDIIFLKDNVVVGLEQGVPVLSEKRVKVDAESKEVIELKAGQAAAQGIVAGSRFVKRSNSSLF